MDQPEQVSEGSPAIHYKPSFCRSSSDKTVGIGVLGFGFRGLGRGFGAHI